MSDLFMKKGASISECGRYRYSLWRIWSDAVPYLPFVMLNPSTADGEVDDPTIRRCMGFARREGFGGIEVVNLFAWRATDPKELEPLTPDARTGPGNDGTIDGVLAYAWTMTRQARDTPIVCAWGAHALAEEPGRAVLNMIEHRNVLAVCLGKTASGAPRHPLYVRNDQPLETMCAAISARAS